jgi:hypothetical protein
MVLRWIARFAFATAPLLAARWSVSPQRMGARLRRLERDGLVTRTRRRANRPALVCVSSLGAHHLGGLRAPRTPRHGLIGHELAIGKRVVAIERHFAARAVDGGVLTERDMRRAQVAGQGRYAARVRDASGRRRRRWPDYVVETPEGRTAVELEFSAKSTQRLQEIVRGYLASRLYEFVDFVLLEGGRHEALWRRLEAIIDHESAVAAGERLFEDEGVARVRLVAWFDPLPALHAGIHPFPTTGTPQPTSAGEA